MNLRPSNFGVFMRCAASVTLPTIEETTSDMEAGTRRHARLADEPQRAVDVLGGLGIHVRVEDVRTEVKLSRNGMRGTADVVIHPTDADDLVVIDWKGPWSRTDAWAQLSWYALAEGGENVWPQNVVRLVVVNVDDDLNVVSVEQECLSCHDMARFARALDGQIARAADVDPPFAPGEHCERCQSFRVCPAQTTLVGAMVKLEPQGLTIEAAGVAWGLIKRYRQALDAAEEAIRLLAIQGPIPLEDGKVLGPFEQARESVDADKVVEWAMTSTGGRQFGQLFEAKSSKALLQRAGLTAADFAELRRLGAIKTTLSTSVREHKP